MAVLAIDQGTTSTRALRLEADGTASITHVVEHAQSYPKAGWVEHDPEELIANIRACIASSGPVDAIGIDNQGESCLAWDSETKEALSQIIVWQDSRTEPEIARLKADGIEADLLDRAGLPLDPYFSASKLAWLFAALPDARERLDQGRLRLGTTDAFFLDRLTGHCITDVTTASRTSLMNIATGQWDPALCDLFGVPITALPEIAPTTGAFGTIRADAADVPVTASIVDQQAALYGHGCRAPGDAKVTFGTGAFALMVTGNEMRRAPEKGLLPTIAWQRAGDTPTYAIDGGVYCASAAVNWARSLGLFSTYDQINGFAAPPAVGRGLVFVPALAGLACPHWDRAARGTWFGMSLETGPRDLMQAVLEGIAFRAAEVIDAMDALVPLHGPLSIDGGLANNPYFCQVLADSLDRDIHVSEAADLTAIGTAMLTAEAAGLDIAYTGAGHIVSSHGMPDEYRAAFRHAIDLCRRWPRVRTH